EGFRVLGPWIHAAAEGPPVLVQTKRGLRRGRAVEEILRVERRVAEEFEQVAVIVACPGLVRQVDGATSAAPELSVGDRRFHAEFLNGFDGREYQYAEAVMILVVVDAVEKEVVLFQPLAIDGVPDGPALHRDRAAGGLRLRRHRAGRQAY